MPTSSSLHSAYEELLRTHGLDRIEQSMESVTESFMAMDNAGWFENSTVDRASLYEEVVEGVKNVAYSYNPLLTLIASEVEDDIRLRGGNVPCSVFVGGFPLGTANACIMPVADGALVLFNYAADLPNWESISSQLRLAVRRHQ